MQRDRRRIRGLGDRDSGKRGRETRDRFRPALRENQPAAVRQDSGQLLLPVIKEIPDCVFPARRSNRWSRREGNGVGGQKMPFISQAASLKRIPEMKRILL